MTTRQEAETYVTTTLGDYADDHDIDAIIDDIHDQLGHYDFTKTEDHSDWYWEVVKKHAYPDLMEQIFQSRVEYLSALAEAETKKRVSDDLIREGIKAGYSMYAIAKKLHMSESAIAYIRDQDAT